MEAWHTTALDIEEVLAGAVDSDVHLFVADVAVVSWMEACVF